MIKMKAFSVSEINRYIKRILGTDPIVNHVLVEGEISNFTRHSSGHVYFTLKDDFSKISCVMFAEDYNALGMALKDGNGVKITGQISVFERDGRYQLYAKKIDLIGQGALYIEFEKLKQTLRNEGYFDEKHKRSIPRFPRKIAVITSPTGAALQDILSVAQRRGTLSDIVVIPTLVQGMDAPKSIIHAINQAHKIEAVDLIILARGGGSIEELWAFNDVKLAHRIFNSKIPIISGVGHETDYTISDFIADKRAATPSAAAEIAVVSKNEIQTEINKSLQMLVMGVQKHLTFYQMRVNELGVRHMKQVMALKIQEDNESLEMIAEKMRRIFDKKLIEDESKLRLYGESLANLNPMSVLLRGYSLVYKEEHLVNKISEVSIADTLKIHQSDGYLMVTVTDKQIKEKE